MDLLENLRQTDRYRRLSALVTPSTVEDGLVGPVESQKSVHLELYVKTIKRGHISPLPPTTSFENDSSLSSQQ